ncbi:ParB/RepB/Spo0J family partition protein [Paenirhodobacter enshiensis]|uniref:ParB/RepB/Spo0J family partition protein n=1 Tax=Paenirhodobacter enshiensis TaxID=1105367 RepID=UPI003FA2D4EA
MSRAKLIPSVSVLPLDQIEVTDDRLRPVSDAAVAAIVTSIEEHGLIYPLVVRRTKGPRYELVDGGHRRAALMLIGAETAPVRCYEGPAPAIRLIEIDTNLARADLSDLDRAIHMASRRREYVAEHPETAQGIAGAKARWDATAELAVASFVSMTVEQTGIGERKIRKLVEAGEALDTVLSERLRSAPRRASLNDLLALSKAQPEAREAAVEAFASGAVNKIAKALNPAAPPPVKDPVEEGFTALMTVWHRVPMAARNRFVDAVGVDLARMLGVQISAELPDGSSVDLVKGIAAE